jgi:hypothetical protein
MSRQSPSLPDAVTSPPPSRGSMKTVIALLAATAVIYLLVAAPSAPITIEIRHANYQAKPSSLSDGEPPTPPGKGAVLKKTTNAMELLQVYAPQQIDAGAAVEEEQVAQPSPKIKWTARTDPAEPIEQAKIAPSATKHPLPSSTSASTAMPTTSPKLDETVDYVIESPSLPRLDGYPFSHLRPTVNEYNYAIESELSSQGYRIDEQITMCLVRSNRMGVHFVSLHIAHCAYCR